MAKQQKLLEGNKIRRAFSLAAHPKQSLYVTRAQHIQSTPIRRQTTSETTIEKLYVYMVVMGTPKSSKSWMTMSWNPWWIGDLPIFRNLNILIHKGFPHKGTRLPTAVATESPGAPGTSRTLGITRNLCLAKVNGTANLRTIGYWLVVDLPLWKIWVRQMGWWNSQYMESHKIHVPNHQPG